MKILYFAPFQHPKVRGPNRHYHFIRELSQRHEITLFALKRAEISKEAFEEIKSYTNQLQLFSPNGKHSQKLIEKSFSKIPVLGNRVQQEISFKKILKQMKKTYNEFICKDSFDVILFHGKNMFPVIKNKNHLPIVTDFCDASSMRYKSKMLRSGFFKIPSNIFRYLQFKQVEKKMVKKSSQLAFISYRDKKEILGSNSDASVIPNGLDLTYWKNSSKQRESNSVIFTGIMNYAPNEDASIYLIDKILPIVKQSIPDIKVYIVGRDPTPKIIKKASNNPNVVVTGFVNDVRPYIERATVFAAPVRYASGMQNKIQEALAMEIPVVTTSIVAAGMRINGKDNAPLIIADGKIQFAKQLVNLLKDEKKQKQLAIEGRKFAENHFSWSRSAMILEKLCNNALERTNN